MAVAIRSAAVTVECAFFAIGTAGAACLAAKAAVVAAAICGIGAIFISGRTAIAIHTTVNIIWARTGFRYDGAAVAVDQTSSALLTEFQRRTPSG